MTLHNLGQQTAIPHAILFSGPSGCGKTTLARIVRRGLQCADVDYIEHDAANYRGIDHVRDIASAVFISPLAGPVRVWTLDEVHRITGPAADALLKLLEDTPEHVYFMLCTTEPQKLLRTIRTRCLEIELQPLSYEAGMGLVQRVAEAEGMQLVPLVVSRVVELAGGSARKALVLLHSLLGTVEQEQQLAMLRRAVGQDRGATLSQLLFQSKPSWQAIAQELESIADDELETVRRGVLRYARKILLRNSKQAPLAHDAIREFSQPFYDSQAAGMAAACWILAHPPRAKN